MGRTVNHLPGHPELFLVIPIRGWDEPQAARTVGSATRESPEIARDPKWTCVVFCDASGIALLQRRSGSSRRQFFCWMGRHGETQIGNARVPALAKSAGEFLIGGDLRVTRLGFGAMRITGDGVWGEPSDRAEAVRVLRRTVELG